MGGRGRAQELLIDVQKLPPSRPEAAALVWQWRAHSPAPSVRPGRARLRGSLQTLASATAEAETYWVAGSGMSFSLERLVVGARKCG